MPEMLERKLRADARRKGMTGERADAYVYGTMRRRMGWTPDEEKKHREVSKKTHKMPGGRMMKDSEMKGMMK